MYQKILPFLCLLFLGFATPFFLNAQIGNQNICSSNCSSKLFEIKIDEDLPAGKRTGHLKKAYLDFQAIKEKYVQKLSWQNDYKASQIGGKSCLRHYQLESLFAHEALINPEFKTWVASQGQSGEEYLKFGFNNARKGLNLQQRMESSCPSRVKEVRKKVGPTLENLRNEYMKMGQELGYFDENGNIIKQFEIPEEEKAAAPTPPVVETPTLNPKLAEWQQGLSNLKSDKTMEEELAVCEADLKKFFQQLNPVQEKQENIKASFGKVQSKSKTLFQRIGDLELFQGKLKGKLPVVGKLITRLEGVIQKTKQLGGLVKNLLSKKDNLEERINGVNSQLADVQEVYQKRQQKVEKLQKDLGDLMEENLGLKTQLDDSTQQSEDLEKAYNDFVQKHNLFTEEAKCLSQNDLEEKLNEVQQEQAAIEPQVEELQKEIAQAEAQENELATETQTIETENDEAASRAAELKKEEEAIKEQFGKGIKLKPVSAEEWTEEFAVKRELWDAEFHPDDEVVKGYKGRWFQVNLKNADQKVKLLFKPGKYYMSKTDFKENYGSVIVSFVTEALGGMKTSEQGAVKLFVQGSADISGQNSFRGKLDNDYPYDNISVLPQEGNSENFGSTPAQRTISATAFTNDDLPNLRGQYLKEMISVYSKKLEPILLEGSVKKKADEADRNAVIYLFIPEGLGE